MIEQTTFDDLIDWYVVGLWDKHHDFAQLGEIREWCHKTFLIKDWFDYSGEYLYFRNESDAILFELKWGHNDHKKQL